MLDARLRGPWAHLAVFLLCWLTLALLPGWLEEEPELMRAPADVQLEIECNPEPVGCHTKRMVLVILPDLRECSEQLLLDLEAARAGELSGPELQGRLALRQQRLHEILAAINVRVWPPGYLAGARSAAGACHYLYMSLRAVRAARLAAEPAQADRLYEQAEQELQKGTDQLDDATWRFRPDRY